MADPFQKVKPGDPVMLPAEAWNAALDAAANDRDLRRAVGDMAPSIARTPTYVKVYNTTAATLPRYHAAWLGTNSFDSKIPYGSFDEWQRDPTLNCYTPSYSPSAGDIPWVVTMEPIQPGMIGRAVLLGIVPTLVQIRGSTHRYVNIDGESTLIYPRSRATSTRAAILWKAPAPAVSTDIYWCYLLLTQTVAGGGVKVMGRLFDGSYTTVVESAQTLVFWNQGSQFAFSNTSSVSTEISIWYTGPVTIP